MAAHAASLIVSKPVQTASSHLSQKVIIIGAGLSGLAAAHHLKQRGISSILLESRDRIGGRLRTYRQENIVFDEGASWIHGPVGNPITPLARAAGLQTFLTRDADVAVFDIGGQPYSDKVLSKAERRYQKLIFDMDGALDKGFGEAFYQEYPELKQDRLWTYMLSAFMAFDTGADISQLSSLDFYDDEGFAGDDLIITNGFDRLTDYLGKDLDISLNTSVDQIDYTGDQMIIRSNQGNITGDYVVVTAPLGVLKKGKIGFNPSLPADHQAAIDQLGMGVVNKFLCLWDEVFWDDRLQYIGFTPEESGKFNYFLNVHKFAEVPALMTFAFGDYAIDTEKMSDAEIIAAITAHLRAIYGETIPTPRKMVRTKWHQDPDTFGSYSYVPKGTRSEIYGIFESSVADRLFFAGEHTIRDYRGTVHGAYISGLRAAEAILSEIE